MLGAEPDDEAGRWHEDERREPKRHARVTREHAHQHGERKVERARERDRRFKELHARLLREKAGKIDPELSELFASAQESVDKLNSINGIESSIFTRKGAADSAANDSNGGKNGGSNNSKRGQDNKASTSCFSSSSYSSSFSSSSSSSDSV